MGDETTTIPSSKHKYLQAVWELFHTELVFLYRQLFVLRDVYKEPLKRCQVEGCLLLVEPDLLFGNLDQLCRFVQFLIGFFFLFAFNLTCHFTHTHTFLFCQNISNLLSIVPLVAQYGRQGELGLHTASCGLV